jgi:hypothetical protein
VRFDCGTLASLITESIKGLQGGAGSTLQSNPTANISAIRLLCPSKELFTLIDQVEFAKYLRKSSIDDKLFNTLSENLCAKMYDVKTLLVVVYIALRDKLVPT